MDQNISTEDVQIGITLASIAYLGEDSDPEGQFTAMARALQQTDLPTNTEWGLVWGPVNHDSNLMYVAQGPITPTGRKYAVAIRGTIKSVRNILEDVELDLVNLPWPSKTAPEGAKISYGIGTAFNRLLGLRDPKGVTAIDFLNGLGAGDEVLVCGHSLGGCLTTVMSLYLSDLLPKPTIRSAPFAGQTAGNQEFADWYTDGFGPTARWANRLDIVPRFWNHATLKSIRTLYPGGPECHIVFKGLVDIGLVVAGHRFYQPGPGSALDGCLYSESGLGDFEEEVEAQHNHLYYMFLTGIALSVIQGSPFHPGLGSGWWPPGRGED